jgi:hypothetical protein
MSNLAQESPDSHVFIIMGTGNLFLCHLPMFFMPNHSYQVILEVQLAKTDNDTYLTTRNQNPVKPLIVVNNEKMLLRDIIHSGSFSADAFFANEDGEPIDPSNPFLKSAKVTVNKWILFEPLNPNSQYPASLTYYLYGSNPEFHLSHRLTRAPNFQQELDVAVSGDVSNKIKEHIFELAEVLIPSLNEINNQPITNDPLSQTEYPIRMVDDTTGNILIKNKFWINNTSLNMTM